MRWSICTLCVASCALMALEGCTSSVDANAPPRSPTTAVAARPASAAKTVSTTTTTRSTAASQPAPLYLIPKTGGVSLTGREILPYEHREDSSGWGGVSPPPPAEPSTPATPPAAVGGGPPPTAPRASEAIDGTPYGDSNVPHDDPNVPPKDLEIK